MVYFMAHILTKSKCSTSNGWIVEPFFVLFCTSSMLYHYSVMNRSGWYWRNEDKQVLIVVLKELPHPNLANITSGLDHCNFLLSGPLFPFSTRLREVALNHKSDLSNFHSSFEISSDFSSFLAYYTKSCTVLSLHFSAVQSSPHSVDVPCPKLGEW